MITLIHKKPCSWTLVSEVFVPLEPKQVSVEFWNSVKEHPEVKLRLADGSLELVEAKEEVKEEKKSKKKGE